MSSKRKSEYIQSEKNKVTVAMRDLTNHFAELPDIQHVWSAPGQPTKAEYYEEYTLTQNDLVYKYQALLNMSKN